MGSRWGLNFNPDSMWAGGQAALSEHLGLPGTIEMARPSADFIGPGRSGGANWKSIRGRALRGAASSYFLGGASAVLPIPPDWIGSMGRAAVGETGKAAGRIGFKAVAQGALRTGGAILGVGMTGYRLASEVPGNGVIGGVERGSRIIGEEVSSMAGFSVGAEIGSMAGAFIGGALGSVALPGLGTVGLAGVGSVVGGVVGGFIGSSTIGAAGARAWNAGMDVAFAPVTGAKFLHDLGIRSRRLELGGRVSAANTTRLAATMRQRALGEINRSGMNARSLLGREASLVHTRM